MPRDVDASTRPGEPLALALVIVAALVAAGLLVAPLVPVSPLVSPAFVFLGACGVPGLALFVASLGKLSDRASLVLLVAAALVLVGFAVFPPSHVAMGVLIDVSLVAVAHTIGAAIGSRVQHAGHFLPAAVVAACADIVSVTHPSGPTHQLVKSERALTVVAFSFPPPGARDLVPALGVGDLVFLALALAVGVAHGVSRARIALLGVVGALAAGALSVVLERPIPALPAIGAALLLGTPAFRRVPPRDKRVAALAIFLSLVAAVAVVIRER